MHLMVLINTDTPENAKLIAENLVTKRLAACVNIISNVTSVYRWEGKIVKDNEFTLVVKTLKNKFKDLEKEVVSLHTYDTPEIIAFDISCGNEKYLKWLEIETNR